MMAEARRLRERRKALYSRGKDANFAPARAATLEMDDAPLMASYSSLPDASRSFSAREKKAAEAFGRDAGDAARLRISSETPEKPPLRVSASLASPSPVKPTKPPVAGGPREPVQYDPSRRPGGEDGEDAYAAFDRAPAPPERRPAVEPFAFAAEEDGVATPPSPRSPAVSWKMGALELPEALLPGATPGEENASNKAPPGAETDAAATAASAAASKEPPRVSVPAVLRRAAEARAVLAAGGGGSERGASASDVPQNGSETPLKASGRRLLFRGEDLRYAPPAEVSVVEADETARGPETRATNDSSDGESMTDYGSLDDDAESRESDGDLTAAAAAAVAAQLARANTEA